jgi:hypothetical protein
MSEPSKRLQKGNRQMTVKFDVMTVESTEPEKLTPPQIYTLLDARARDWRQIMIASLAAIMGCTVAAINSMHSDMNSWDWIKIAGLFAIAAAIGLVVYFLIRPEIRETITRAELIRGNYILNWDKVPPIDGFLPRPLRKKPWPCNLGSVTAEEWTSPEAEIKR